jgi:hypothetical protein
VSKPTRRKVRPPGELRQPSSKSARVSPFNLSMTLRRVWPQQPQHMRSTLQHRHQANTASPAKLSAELSGDGPSAGRSGRLCYLVDLALTFLVFLEHAAVLVYFPCVRRSGMLPRSASLGDREGG